MQYRAGAQADKTVFPRISTSDLHKTSCDDHDFSSGPRQMLNNWVVGPSAGLTSTAEISPTSSRVVTPKAIQGHEHECTNQQVAWGQACCSHARHNDAQRYRQLRARTSKIAATPASRMVLLDGWRLHPMRHMLGGCGKGWCLCPRPQHVQQDDDVQVRAQNEEVDGSSFLPKGDGTNKLAVGLPDVFYANYTRASVRGFVAGLC
jgi:hypothetical protein